jgi:hypothetical protein
MALRNLKYYVKGINQNRNAAVLQQIQFEANAADPTDADLAAGRLHYKTSVGLRWYDGSTWYTIPTTSSGGGLSAWDSMYALDKTLTIDSTTLTFAGTHATGDVLTVTNATGSGDCIQITNSGSGSDIEGTSGTWTVSAAGAAVFTAITGCDSLTAAANLALEATGAGTISIGAASTGAIDIGTGGGAITLVTAVTASLGITITAGGLLSSDGIVDIVDNSNAASGLRVTNDTVDTYGNAADAGVVVFRSESLSTGTLLQLSVDETGMAGGYFLRCWSQDAAAAAFTIGELGLTTIAGNASGTDALVLTNGDILVTAGNIDITAGYLTLADGRFSMTESANAAAFAVTANGTTNASGVVWIGTGTHTGSTTTSWMTVTNAGLTTGTAAYHVCAALTEGKVMHLATGATQTTGSILYVQNTGNDCALTSGTVATFDHTAAVIASAVNKTGSIVSISSARTVNTGGNTSDNFDCLSVIKATTRTAGTAVTAGSVVYVELQTTGTVTETSNGVEILMDSGGTGSAISATHSATAGRLFTGVSAATTVSDFLITGSGAKADNKAVVEIASTGSTAAGGSLLRVAHSGTGDPAAATSYLVDFDQSGATCSGNPNCVSINGGASTGVDLITTKSGAGYSLATYMTGTGATGVQWFTQHTSTGSAADNDIVFSLLLGGLSDTDVARQYGAIKVTAIDVSNATEDAKMDLQVMVAGTLTSLLYVQSSTAGATTMACAAAASTFAGSAAGTAALTVTNGDISLSAGKFISTTTADIYGLDVTVNKATATQGVAVFTNASTTSGKAVLELEQADLDQPYLAISGATAITSANAGANGDVPAQVVGYILVKIDGTDRKVPYYAS